MSEPRQAAGAEPTPEQRRALFHVVRGEPTDVELAALTVVLAAVAGGSRGDAPPPPPRSAWSDRAAALRGPLMVGPNAWRTTYLPR